MQMLAKIEFNFYEHVSGFDITNQIIWLPMLEDPNVLESALGTQMLCMPYRYLESAGGMMAASGFRLALKPASAETARISFDFFHPLTT